MPPDRFSCQLVFPPVSREGGDKGAERSQDPVILLRGPIVIL